MVTMVRSVVSRRSLAWFRRRRSANFAGDSLNVSEKGKEGSVGMKGQVCIASRGKVKKYCIEVDFGENANSADVFGRALGFRGTVFP